MSDDNFVSVQSNKIVQRKWQILGLVSVGAACYLAGQTSVATSLLSSNSNQSDMKYDGGDNTQSLIQIDNLNGRRSSEMSLGSRSSRGGGGSTSTSGSSSRNKEGWGIGEAILGFFMITFAIPMVWMNERKDVKYREVILAGQEAIQQADANTPKPENEMQLIYCRGQTVTEGPCMDQMFGVGFEQTLKIKRTVEVFQWHEKTRKEGENTITWYEPEWSQEVVSESGFTDAQQIHGPHNPSEDEWPVKKDVISNYNAIVGAMQMTHSQVDRVNDYKPIDINSWQGTIQSTSQFVFETKGWSGLQRSGEWMSSRPERNNKESSGLHEPVVGDMRIKWEIVPCTDVQIMAQQLPPGKSGRCTFRPWNPKDIHAPIGQEVDVTSASCPVTCFPCWAVEKCMKSIFKEHIDEIRTDGKESNQIFQEMNDANNATTKCFRILAYVMNVVGHYLIFTPLIRVLSWIPLLGWLLSKVIAVAVAIFAFIWGTMLHLFVMSFAWIFYRPLFGIGLLLAGGTLLYFITRGNGETVDTATLDLLIDAHYGYTQETIAI